MRTILHVSDLHFGKTDPLVIAKLLDACLSMRPDVVVMSGDLTQRATVQEFTDARTFITRIQNIGISCFVIPGNHDIRPLYRPIARALRPYDRYREFIAEDIEPRFLDEELAIASIDTVRRARIANGAISTKQIERVQTWFATLDKHVTRIVVTHHPLDLPRHRVRPLVGRAKRAVYGLAASRVDIYLAGHYHHSSAITTDERYRRLTSPSVAVQAGTVSMRERGEAQSFNMLTLDGSELRVDTYRLNDPETRFAIERTRRFIRDRGVWRGSERAGADALSHTDI